MSFDLVIVMHTEKTVTKEFRHLYVDVFVKGLQMTVAINVFLSMFEIAISKIYHSN